MVEKKDRLPEGYAFGPKRRDGDGGDQQDGSDHGQDALSNHMNSFSVFRSVYKPAT